MSFESCLSAIFWSVGEILPMMLCYIAYIVGISATLYSLGMMPKEIRTILVGERESRVNRGT